jgi:hypothetical protein
MRRRVLWLLLPIVAAAVAIRAFPDDEPLISIVDIALASVGAAAFTSFIPAIWRQGYSPGARRLALGVMLMAAGFVTIRGYATVWRIAGEPAYWYPSSVVLLSRFVVVYGLALVFSAPSITDGLTPQRFWLATGAIVGLLTAVCFGLARWFGYADDLF